MFNTALHRLLGAAYGPTYRLAGIEGIAWKVRQTTLSENISRTA